MAVNPCPRSGWLWVGLLVLGCEPTAEVLPTETPAASTPAPTATTAPFLLPDVDFRIHPDELTVPMGEQVTLVPANYGVPIPWSQVQYTISEDRPSYGTFDPATGVYSAAPDEVPEPSELTFTATWRDPYGRDHTASAVVHLSGWAWVPVGGPGSGCVSCKSQVWLSSDLHLWVYRHGYGLWRIEPDSIDPPVGGPGEPPEPEVDPCVTPPIDPMEQTPPGQGTPVPPPTQPPPPTPTPTPSATPVPTPTGTATATPEATPTAEHEFTWHAASGVWTRMGQGLDASFEDARLFPIPGEPLGVMAVAGGRLYRSPDGGQTFSEQDAPGRPETLAFFPESNHDLIVPTSVEQGHYIARSSDGGQTWVSWGSDIAEAITSVVVVPRLTTRVIAATDNALYVSADGGKTFTQTLSGFSAIYSLSAHLLGVAWALVDLEGERVLLYSNTSGGAWEPYAGIPGCTPSSVSVDPNNPYSMWVGCDGGLLLASYDGGVSFQTAPSQIDTSARGAQPQVLNSRNLFVDVVIDGDDHFYGYIEGSWEAFSGGPGPEVSTMRAGTLLRPVEGSHETVLRAFPGLVVGAKTGWLESTVSPVGAFWIGLYEAPLPDKALLVDLAYDGSGRRALGVTPEGALYFGDGIEGEWAAEPLPQPTRVVSVDLGPGELPTFYAYGEGEGGWVLYKRTDSEPWLAVDAPSGGRLRADTAQAGLLYVFADGVLYRSTDDGASWQADPHGGLGERVAIGMKSEAGEVLLGADYGLYTSEDQAASFTLRGWTEGPVTAMCTLAPRTEQTSTDSAPTGTSGYMATTDAVGTGVWLSSERRFSPVDGMAWRDSDGSPRAVAALEPNGGYPGAAFAQVDGVGIVLVRPAPAAVISEPGGDGGLPPTEGTPPPACP